MAESITIRLDGTNFNFSASQVTAIDARDFRAAVGVPIMQVFTQNSVDLDVMAGMIWVVRRRTERGLTYEQVASSITYDSDFAFADADGDGSEETAGPET
ncbi:MAG: hypothetical protein ACRD2W_18400 [Acidimicrobiales bacterium]